MVVAHAPVPPAASKQKVWAALSLGTADALASAVLDVVVSSCEAGGSSHRQALLSALDCCPVPPAEQAGAQDGVWQSSLFLQLLQ